MKLFIPVIILTLASCNLKPTEDWSEIRKTKSVYPRDSLVMSKFVFLQDTKAVWINAAYEKYPYKEFCTNSIKATFDLAQPVLLEKLGKDSLNHAHMLSDIFKQSGVAHFVGQTIYKNNLVVYMYLENDLNAMIALHDYAVPANARIETDLEWKAYDELLNEKK